MDLGIDDGLEFVKGAQSTPGTPRGYQSEDPAAGAKMIPSKEGKVSKKLPKRPTTSGADEPSPVVRTASNPVTLSRSIDDVAEEGAKSRCGSAADRMRVA